MLKLLEFILGRLRGKAARYELIQEIGEGGMSKVWKAKDLETGSIVALKILHPKSVALMRTYRKLFHAHEGQIALGLDHPNVIRTFDFGTWERKTYFIAMEYVDGPALDKLIRVHDERVRQARYRIIMQTAEGLRYLHQKGLIHRDFCPKNVLYGSDGLAKIIDFGLTIPAWAEQRVGLERAGTASYMAPEQIRRLKLDERTDIYAFGLTAFELLTFARPFREVQSKRSRIELHLNIEPVSPLEIDPTVPPQIAKIVVKCIEKEARLRYKNMGEVIDALTNALEKLEGQSKPQGSSQGTCP